MWHPGLLVRRVAGAPGVVVAAAVIALFATTVLAALVGHSGNVTREGARRTLADATFAQAGTRISAPVPPGGFTTARQRVDTALRRIYREVPLTVSAGARSDTFTLPGQEGRRRPELAVFATYSGIERHAELLSGRWPRPAGEVEAVLPAPAAQAMRLEPGAVLTMRGRVDTGRTVRARIVGIFSPGSADDYFWQGDRLVGAGVERLDYTTYGPLVVRPEVFAGAFATTGGEVRWTVRPDLGGLDAAAATALGRRVRAGERTFAEVDPGTQYAVATELPALTAQLRGAVLVARSTMLMPVLQLLLLAGYALVLVARLLADHRRVEVALLRTRGASLRQLGALTLAEGLVTVLPAAVLGPLLAGPLLAAVGEVPAVRAAGLRLTPDRSRRCGAWRSRPRWCARWSWRCRRCAARAARSWRPRPGSAGPAGARCAAPAPTSRCWLWRRSGCGSSPGTAGCRRPAPTRTARRAASTRSSSRAPRSRCWRAARCCCGWCRSPPAPPSAPPRAAAAWPPRSAPGRSAAARCATRAPRCCWSWRWRSGCCR
ncbi:FtsX-like permease family protein [Spirillospora sp. CA-253888]